MPPPPPPSKSYLLRFDTDSESDNNDDDDDREATKLRDIFASKMNIQTKNDQMTNMHSMIHDLTKEEEDSSTVATHPLEDRNDHEVVIVTKKEEDDAEVKSSLKGRKKRKRKRHRKKKHQTTAEEDMSMLPARKKERRVSFASVSLRFMERELGGDGVPGDGGWPMCLSNKIVEEVNSLSVDQYEDHRRLQLEKRWDGKKEDLPESLETRQWDYRKQRDERTGRSIRNPLFDSLNEDERHALLIDQPISTIQKKSHGNSSSSSNNNHNHNKHNQHHNKHHQNHTRLQRARSNSMDMSAVGPYDPVHVRHVRRELEDLRVCRSTENMGCSCRKLQVPCGGKKSKRFSVSKVKDELRKRRYKLNPSTKYSREELEQTLYKLVQDEPCCNSNDCPCIRNGLGCQADTCSCWSHVPSSTTNKDSKPMSIQERCGNKLGMYVVDFDYIASYRKNMIAKMTSSSIKKNTFVTSSCS